MAAYRFFKSHRAVFYLLLITSFVLLAVLAGRMYYEEDISKLLPVTENNKGARYAFERLKVKDKIFLLFRMRQQTLDKESVADSLVVAASVFCDSLQAHDKQGDIEDIFNSIEPSLLADGADFILDNAPCFLNTSFYPQLDKILNQKSLDSLMQLSGQLLESDISGMWYDIVCKDPLAFRSIAMKEFSDSEKGKKSGLSMVSMHLFSRDSTCAIALLSPAFKAMDSKAGTRLIDLILKEKQCFEEAHPDIQVLFYGAPVQSVFNAKRIKKDLIVTVSIALLMILLIIGYCFKTKDTLLYLLIPLAWGTIMAVAAMYLLQGQMSFIALGIGCIVIGVALSYCIHIITHHKYISDTEQVIKDQAKPVMLGCLTTVGSLLGLIFTKSPLLRDFGLMASFVMVGTTLAAIFFLPQFFRGSGRKDEKAFASIEKITTYPYHKKKWLIILICAVFIASVFFTGGKADFDTDLTHLGHYEKDVITAESLYRDKVQDGMLSQYYAVYSKDLDSALQLNQLMAQECLAMQASGSYNITGVSNMASFLIPSFEQEARISEWNAYFTPEKKAQIKKLTAAAAQRNGFEAEMFEPFYEAIDKQYNATDLYSSGVVPQGLMNNFIEKSPDGTYLVFTSVSAPSKDAIKKISTALAEGGISAAQGLKGHVLVVDPFFYTTDMLQLMEHDFNTVLLISSLFVLLILFIALRNFVHAIIAFLPMFMSWFMVLGLMKCVGLEFNLINIVVSTFIFGMGVDYSIFVMDGLTKGRDRKDLLKYHRSAIFFSAVMLILAVSLLMFAVHPAISSIGLSTLVGMLFTITITFTLQPFLFYKWEELTARLKDRRSK